MDQFERPMLDRTVEMIRTYLDEDAYDLAFAEGRAMPTEQAAELALELAEQIQASSP
jgi:hypothetical protein